MAWKLRNDERVVCMEKTNFRYLTRADIADDLDFASVDVSFISLTKILLPARELLKDGGRMVCLIKPQFEAGKEKVGKKGVVRDESVHIEVIEKIFDFIDILDFSYLALDYSPIKGPEGNIEYLIYIEKKAGLSTEHTEDTESSVLQKLREVMEEGTGFSKLPENQKVILDTVKAAHATLDV